MGYAAVPLRQFRALSLAATALLLARPLTAQSPRDVDLTLKPHLVDGRLDYIDITMKLRGVDARAGAPLLSMEMIEAGVPTARYEASALVISDNLGPIHIDQKDDPEDPANNHQYRHWTANRAVNGELTVAYHATPNSTGRYRAGPVMDMRAEDGGMNGRAGYFLVLPDDSAQHRVRVHWDLSGMPPASRGVWTFGEGDATALLTPEKLIATIFMAGPIKSYPATMGKSDGHFFIYWQTAPNWDINAVAPALQKIYAYYGQLFQDTTHTMRVFMRRGRSNGGSGAGGSFLMYTPSADDTLPPMNTSALVAFLSHEMLHQFPEEFDDVDVGEPTYWWSEGIATYYSNLIVYRLGMKSLDEFLADWSKFLRNYYADPNRMLSYAQLTGGMFGRVGLNLMYGKGQAFMMLLNSMIRDKSGGTRSLDDLAFPLIRQHLHGGSYTRADFLAALDRELGPQGRAAYEAFRAGGKLLDLPPDLMGPCFKREPAKYRPSTRGAAATAPLDSLDGFRWARNDSVPESACKL